MRLKISFLVILTLALTIAPPVAMSRQPLPLNCCEVIFDSTPPQVVLNGPSIIEVPINGIYTELGAQAIDTMFDDVSGSITITGTVNTQIANIYTLEYRATDPPGNVSLPAIRTVKIVAEDTTRPVISIN